MTKITYETKLAIENLATRDKKFCSIVRREVWGGWGRTISYCSRRCSGGGSGLGGRSSIV